MAAALVTVALVVSGTGAEALAPVSEVEAVERTAPCHGPRFATDGVPPRIERAHNRRVILCAFRRVAPGQGARAVDVARCESGLDDEASNGGRYLGTFQHARRYWPGRARSLPNWVAGPSPGAFHALANAWAAARLVRSSGWSPWGCA